MIEVSLRQRDLRHSEVRERLATIQMLDVWLLATDGRWLVMPRFTQPEADQAILRHKLKLDLPQQPPPRIKTRVPEFLGGKSVTSRAGKQ